jgi:hypothetical protein
MRHHNLQLISTVFGKLFILLIADINFFLVVSNASFRLCLSDIESAMITLVFVW